MKVLLLGGTSFFGRDIARHFFLSGHQVTRFTRGNVNPDAELNLGHIQGDRKKIADLKKTNDLGPWDLVIDNLAYDGQDVENVLNTIRGIGRYLLTSTISVYRFSNARFPQPMREAIIDYDHIPSEEDTNDIHWQYARGKLEAEKRLVRQNKIDWTIFRPSIVYGPHDSKNRGAWYLGRLLQGGPILLGDGGLNSFRIAFSRDVAQAYLSAVEHPNTKGKIFNLAQEEIISLRDFILESARTLGVKPNLVSVPLASLKELAGPLAYEGNWIPDISAAKNEFSFSPTPWQEVASISAAWFRDCWEGSEEELFKTRKRELEFANQWALATGKLAG